MHDDIKQNGTAKALFKQLSNISLENQSSSSPENLGSTFSSNSKEAAIFEQFKATSAGVSRRYVQFEAAPAFDPEQAPSIVKSSAEELGVTVKSIHQNKTGEEIQANLEMFIRERDRRGFEEYIQDFCEAGVSQQFRISKEDKAGISENIAYETRSLIQQAWGGTSNEQVAKSTHQLVKLMSESVLNLYIQSPAESFIEDAVLADQGAIFELAEDGKVESAYNVIIKNGKTRFEVKRAVMGGMFETQVEKMLQRLGFQILESKLKSNHGIDLLAVKRNEIGEVEKVFVVECKATGKSDKTVTLAKTKAGKQLSSTWIAKKIADMYKQGAKNKNLRESAILMRKNLDKLRPIVAFQKNGVGSINQKDQRAVPEFDPAIVEALLKKEKWEKDWDK